MARTQAADYDERRLKIVETAARLFARDGFLGASVADVADACELSKSALYHYYASKEDILYDVMHSHIVALDDAARAVVEGPGEATDKLRLLVREFMRLYVGAADRHKVLLNDLLRLPKPRRQAIVAMQRGLIDTVADLLCEIEPGLRMREAERRPAAMLVFGMINWTHVWFDPAGAVSAEALADMAVDLTLGGLKQAV
ncbi:transcriptional regulator of TetR family [alpha proteobacterium U9-1i]|nr:transcriptional regulator of TetR family [alpha proteobacterium U9-1i]